MNRRRLMMHRAGATPVLPAEYQRVEWIGSTLGAYITLPTMNISQNSVVKCRFYKQNQATSEEALFVAQTSTTAIEIGFTSNNKLFAYSGGGSSSSITSPLIYGNWVDYTAVYQSEAPTKKCTAIINGSVVNGTDGTGTNVTGSSRCALFRSPDGNARYCVAQLASLTLSLEGTLSLNLIPSYRKSDNVIGVYDAVSQTFLSGTGSFRKGADI